MNGSDLTLAIVLLALICLSCFFAVCETAFSSANTIRLKKLAKDGSSKAKRTLKLIENYDKMLSSVLIGNNIVNIVASALATVLFVSLFGSIGVPIATVFLTVVVLIFADITPKTIAKELPEKSAMACSGLLQFFVTILAPINYLTSLWRNFIIKAFKINRQHGITEEELLTYVEEVRQVGGINEHEETMIRSAIEFDELEASDIFTPRVDVVAVSITDTPDSVDKIFHKTGYSRLPVYEGTIDNIVGIIIEKDFHYYIKNSSITLEDILRPTIFVPRNAKIPALLKQLQKNKLHMSVVVDDFGGTLGIVTIEDILEELVGEIWDEHDEIVEHIKEIKQNTYAISANTDLNDFKAHFKIKDSTSSAPTVGGWVLELFGHVPKEGDSITFKNLQINVAKILRNRVLEIVVTVTSSPNDAETSV